MSCDVLCLSFRNMHKEGIHIDQFAKIMSTSLIWNQQDNPIGHFISLCGEYSYNIPVPLLEFTSSWNHELSPYCDARPKSRSIGVGARSPLLRNGSSYYGSLFHCWKLIARETNCRLHRNDFLKDKYTKWHPSWRCLLSRPLVSRPLPTHRRTQTQNKLTQTSMPRVGSEPTIPVSELAKKVHALDRAATVMDH
jgi:hypothetical protein